MSENFYFEGNVNLYLQGEKALAVDEQNPRYLQYYLGSRKSRIRIRDFRNLPRKVAEQSIVGKGNGQFKDFFCQPANVIIQLKRGDVNIDLHDLSPETCHTKNPISLLWLGVIKDGDSIPLRYVDWEVFRSTGDVRTSFAMLVPE